MTGVLKRVAVVGSGVAGALSAAYLSRLLKRLGTEIVWVPAGDAPVPPVLASLPSFEAVHQVLGFDLRDLMRATDATFRLGTEYSVSGGIHAYGDTGAAFGNVPFHLAWRAHSEDTSPGAYGACSLAVLAARAGRFAPPLDGGPPGSVFSPGLHLDGPAYLSFLERAARHYGAIASAPLAYGQTAAESGTLVLSDGSVLSADLVVDTVGISPSADWMPAGGVPDAVQVLWGKSEERRPLGLARLRGVAGNVAVDMPMNADVHRALIAGSEAAAHRATSVLRREGFSPVSASPQAFGPGWCGAPWTGGVVRIGDAACRLPPVEAPELRIIQIGLETLAMLLPGGGPAEPERAEYNRMTLESWRSLADFVSLAFMSPGELPETLPETLRLRLENFISRGRTILMDGESFTRESWVAALIAAGWRMERADAHAAALPQERVRSSLAGIAGTLAASCETLPDQRTFLRRAGLVPAMTGGA
ncbi:tryptophan 7-halogenase [Hyphomonas sp.]|uniref:tryptophan 7-halogenase n=1 Tax=Hyphomonas sp. TaxID=87 RepID=UPI00391B9D09